jgi:hypothetical protein
MPFTARGMPMAADMPAKTMLCLASYEKGAEFIRECKRQGWRVQHLLDDYCNRFAVDFRAVLPPTTDPAASRDAQARAQRPDQQ